MSLKQCLQNIQFIQFGGLLERFGEKPPNLVVSSTFNLDSSNSSSFTFWISKLASSTRSNWTGIWNGTSNGSWTDEHSSHFHTAKDMHKRKSYILFHVKTKTNTFWNNAEMLLQSFWSSHLQMMNGLEPLSILELNW